MSSRAARPRSRRRLVGVSAVAVGALLTTYAGGLRNFSYVRAEPLSAFAGCSPGATQVSDDTQLQAAVASSVDDSVICITADITVSQTLEIDDTTLTLEGGGTFEISGGGTRRIIDADFTDNTSDDTLTIRDIFLTQGRATGRGGAVQIVGGNKSDALVITSAEVTHSESDSGGGGVSARNLSSVDIGLSVFADDSIGTVNDAAGGALEVVDAAHTTITVTFFQDNSSAEWGGAVFLNDSGITRISDSRFERNSSVSQAGVTDTLFGHNSSTSGLGGAVRIDDNDDTVSFSSVTFESNSTGSSGGGLSISTQSGPVYLSDITATDNTAGSSGGFLRIFGMTSTLTIEDLDSRRNYASSDGGSIKQSSGILDLSGSTFVDDSAGSAFSDGGAIYFNDDSASIRSSTFTTNYAGRDGGAVYARVSTSFALQGSTFTQNTADDDAGGLYVRSDDSTASSATVRIEDSQFTGNAGTGADSEGGAVTLYKMYRATVESTYFKDNTSAYDAGALYASDLNSLRISDSQFIGNTAVDDAGGVMVRDTRSAYMYESAFERNTAGDESGGVDITNVYSDLIVDACTFSGNTAADFAGGLYARFAADTQASITNSTFTGNVVSASGSHGGGGLYLYAPNVATAPTIEMDFVTVVGNSAKEGGGIQARGKGSLALTIENSIVAGNSASAGGADVLLDDTATLDDSFSLFTSAGAVSGATIDGPGSIFGAPKLNGLADNGGPTLTMLPLWDSPVFQAGDPNWTAPPANDQRGTGFPRDAGGRVSMGAIQGRSAQPPAPVFPPSAPREVTAMGGDEEVVVSWMSPATTGSFPVTTYQVEDSTGEFTCLVSVAPDQPLACVIDALVNGESYAFRVRALNGAGWGAWSAFSDPVTPGPVASIVITGSRDGRFVRVGGKAPGLEGDALIPRLRFPGPKPYSNGRARPVVDDDGDFTWQRKTRKKVYVYFFTEDREVRSNRVIIGPRR